ncbi:MAG: ADP-glyceromanno-heptose 6-epimerase [Bacteroidales bacterium]|jgi:ADP-L-glycero-D-manno-heptose 6-epimerase|nr:ADP-glyceromanno-heptose 6-epimerase [Bacteroidales bacterium]
MIVVTGAAGFIGSCMAAKLNSLNYNDLILVDDFTKEYKKVNWETKRYSELVPREHFFSWADQNAQKIDFIIHLGARTDTTEKSEAIFEELNIDYSRRVWYLASQKGIPLIYASSAATYGDGKYGYSDDVKKIELLHPLNPYGRSKNDFDKWVLKQPHTPPCWAGFKFFNVYGPNEYHKARMASVVFHSFNQINENGKIQLFRSYRPNFKDGEQLRDFFYVKDLVNVLMWFIDKPRPSSIYNLGTGFARPFTVLANSVFKTLKLHENIQFIDMPEDIRDTYQYYTQADMKKLKAIGYKKPFHTLENGVGDYVSKFLLKQKVM